MQKLNKNNFDSWKDYYFEYQKTLASNYYIPFLINNDVELKDIAQFESKIIEKCKSEKPEIIESISASGKLEEDTEKLLVEIINELKKNLN